MRFLGWEIRRVPKVDWDAVQRKQAEREAQRRLAVDREFGKFRNYKPDDSDRAALRKVLSRYPL